jgi:hypothetical protein
LVYFLLSFLKRHLVGDNQTTILEAVAADILDVLLGGYVAPCLEIGWVPRFVRFCSSIVHRKGSGTAFTGNATPPCDGCSGSVPILGFAAMKRSVVDDT